MLNSYLTHTPMLAACVARLKHDDNCFTSKRPILELGMGHGSTPLLHYLCPEREIVSADINANWVTQFQRYVTETHKHYWIENRTWSAFLEGAATRQWGIVFVDDSAGEQPGQLRKTAIGMFADKTKLLIVHDSEAACYGYEPELAKYKYRFDYKAYDQWTTVVSNIDTLDWLK